MYKDLKESFWWNGVKTNVADFVAQCLVCQKAKIEHQRLGGTLQPLDIHHESGTIYRWIS